MIMMMKMLLEKNDFDVGINSGSEIKIAPPQLM